MNKAERTRHTIIIKSAVQFNKKGYESTSLSDLQKITGFSKGAIYDNFSNKNDLALAAFEYNSDLTYSRIKAAMQQQPTAKAALLAFAAFYPQNWEKLSERGGCPMLNAAVEADDHLDFLVINVRRSMNRAMMLLQHTIERGQQDGEFDIMPSAEKYAAVIFTAVEGGILLAKAMNDPKYLGLVNERIAMIVERELTK